MCEFLKGKFKILSEFRKFFVNFGAHFGAFSLIIFALNGCFSSSTGEVGKKAPQIAAKNLSGQEVKFDEGKVVVLVFFEKGCAACIKELPLLDEFAYEQRDKLQAIAINSVDEVPSIVVLQAQYSLYNVVLAKDDLDISWQRYGIFALPTTIIIKDGVVIERITGDKGWENLHSKLLPLL